jgi:DNA polymerase I-like protein with 3'-5' exonuclease and polymerase domains
MNGQWSSTWNGGNSLTSTPPTPLDFETSRFPDGSPYRQTAQAVSWATADTFAYYTDPDFTSALQKKLDGTTLLIGVNFKYDVGWLRRLGCNIHTGTKIWDCQLAEFVLSGQTVSFASMDELCAKYNIAGKEGGLDEWWNAGVETRDIPRDIVERYNLGDTSRTLAIYHAQLKDSRMTEALKKLILLQGADLLVLQSMEANGIFYDAKGSTAEGDGVLQRCNEIKEELDGLVAFPGFNFDSGDHLSCWLYGGTVSVDYYSPVEMVYKSGPRKGESYIQNKFQRTETKEFEGLFKPLRNTALKKAGYYQTGEPVLRQLPARTRVQKRVLHLLLDLADQTKSVGGFLHALPALMEKQGWKENYLCPTYNQCVARTGRLSCSKPNAQQFPEIVDQFWKSRYE